MVMNSTLKMNWLKKLKIVISPKMNWMICSTISRKWLFNRSPNMNWHLKSTKNFMES